MSISKLHTTSKTSYPFSRKMWAPTSSHSKDLFQYFMSRHDYNLLYITKGEYNQPLESPYNGLESKFDLLVPCGDHEARSVITFHASWELKTFFPKNLRSKKLDNKLNQARDKLNNSNLKKNAWVMFQSQESWFLSLRKQLKENQEEQIVPVWRSILWIEIWRVCADDYGTENWRAWTKGSSWATIQKKIVDT